MKTVREVINEARAQHFDVLIETNEGAYEEMYGGGWTAIGEWGWTEEEDYFDSFSILKINTLDEGIVVITVEG